ncbi:unnamed protein product, partial [Rotaria sp. Silwood1]
MASSSSSLKRSIDNVEVSKENISPKKRINLELTSFQLKIVDIFNNVDLTTPTELL